ncbi:MAG: hypothetical protein H0U45_09245 [Tatlockia sp.]|nr:hypothetical protein [Tatlockia sp.]
MTRLHEQSHAAAELERQQLIRQCHSLVAAIANRPGSTKLLRGIVPTIETFAGYKANVSRQRSHLGAASKKDTRQALSDKQLKKK